MEIDSGVQGQDPTVAARTGPTRGTTNSEYPNYEEDKESLRIFIQEHTVLLPLRQNDLFAPLTDSNDAFSEDDDDNMMLDEEPTAPGMHRVSAYLPLLQKIKDRSMNGTPIIEIPLDELVNWNVTTGDDISKRIQMNTMQYWNLICSVLDTILDSMVESVFTTNERRDAVDILAEQRLENQRLNATNNSNNEVNVDEQVLGINTNTNTNLEGEAFPPLLMRRYELHILPKGRTYSSLATAPTTIQKDSFSLRQIRSSSMGTLTTLTGMIVRVSEVKPICVVATYTCDKCGNEVYQEVSNQRDFLPLRVCPIPGCPSGKTEDSLYLQTRGSKFWKFQEWKLQELPHQVPKGHVPRSMPIHVRGELTRLVSPGDVVTIDGVVLPLRNDRGYVKAGLVTSAYLEAFHVMVHKQSFEEMQIDFEEDAIKAIAMCEDPLLKLAQSIAPEIYGHEDIKKALLLQLVGGCEQTLPDGMRIRGDVNILLVGDPGVAKSQLLKHVSTISPRGVYTTGRGSSGVGLTAAVTRDALTKEMALEGGALVLADKGICCIDEFDKMEEADRTAIHEVMEQQTVSIAKAGIVATLNARAAVLSAANPLYGKYHRKKSLTENINLPNSLISRFDLLFLVLDNPNMEKDLALARHVTRVHQSDEQQYLQTEQTNSNTIPPSTLRQYIAKARQYHPTISSDVSPYIVEAYVGLRMSQDLSHSQHDQTFMTPRQLLSILRLSQALARLRFSSNVLREDVDEAIRLIHSSKSSLLEEANVNNTSNDVTSRIFNIIRDYATTAVVPEEEGFRKMRTQVLEAMVIQRGFTKEQLNSCIKEYEDLHVLQVDSSRSFVTFSDAA